MTFGTAPTGATRLRVALYSGILIRHDAISGSLRCKLDLLEGWRDDGLPIDVVAYVQSTDGSRPGVVVTPTAARAMADPGFAAAHVHLFEFGIFYDLFDLVFVAPRPARRVAVYHNITPLELVEEPGVRNAVERSMRQKANLDAVDHVMCDSEFNQEDLVRYGLAPERLSVLHLPALPSLLAVPKPRGDRAEILYVGRFVRSKGVLDLLRAVRVLRQEGNARFRLTLAGNLAFSDPAVVAEVHRAATDPSVRFVGEPDDRALATLMASSDILVIPSYHEGYCVPVVEAYSVGCQVTAYDAGNLPNVVGELGLLAPTGDHLALARALGEQIAAVGELRRPGATVPTLRGPLPVAEWRRRVATHLSDYSADAYARGLRRVLVDQARQVPGLTPSVIDRLAISP